ncbi:MAG: FCD domain-containing protein [Treponema sp.]|jgi:DNA-binding GntR family transcriptional regulator|nr:FCD domain-containing protein [Treponema sp.]
MPTLNAASRKPDFSKVSALLWPNSQSITALRKETVITHRAITEAIAVRDGKAARDAMTEHIMYNQRFVEKLMAEEAPFKAV